MSSFCVFGNKHDDYLKKMEKKHIKRPNESISEFYTRISLIAERDWLLDKPSQRSPIFDAPQFCDDWMRIASTGKVANMVIMNKGPKLDKNGEPRHNAKTGNAMIGWVQYGNGKS